MKTVREHVDHIKTKPHHIRKQVAFVAAAGGAALIGAVWLLGNLAFGDFALGSHNFAESVGETPSTSDTNNTDTGLAGAASAIPDDSAPAHIEIVNAPSPSSAQTGDQTTIPF